MAVKLFDRIRDSISLEEDGLSFYTECLKSSKDYHTQLLFEFLVKEESRHLSSLKQLLESIKSKNKEDLQKTISSFILIKNPLFQKTDLKDFTGDLSNLDNLINKSMQFEEKGITFFETMMQKESDKLIRQFFHKLILDEMNHKKIIGDFGKKIIEIR